MKTHDLTQSLRYYTGIGVREHEVIRWADLGLLGEVARVNTQRNYSTINFERALIILFVRKILNFPLDNEKLKELFEKKDKTTLEDIFKAIDKLKVRGIPRFEEAVLRLEEK
jgi:DNA-binding transcriptional MerR regulator